MAKTPVTFCRATHTADTVIEFDVERPVVAYSVEKLRFEDSGDFICDLSDIAYCSYEGVVEVA